MSLRIDQIRTDGGTQSRAEINADTVAEYAEAMADPDTVFPPIIVYHDGREYWLADGFHRLEAWRQIGRDEVPTEIRQGNRRRAVLHSCGANAAHGLRRSNADKRRAVMTLLEDDEWSKWSDSEIARRCGVSHPFVAKVRGGLTGNVSSEPRTYTTKHGTEAQMNTARIGNAAPIEQPDAQERDEPAARPVASDTAPGGPVGNDDAPHDPLHAEKLDAAPVEPEVDTPPDPHRKGLSGLTREGLEDECAGLRADNADLRKRVSDQRGQIADLKARIKELTDADDAGRKIGNLQRRLAQSEGRSKEHQSNAARLQRQVNAQKAEIEDLRAKLERQEIVL